MVHKWVFKTVQEGFEDKNLCVVYLDNGSEENGLYVQNAIQAIKLCDTLNTLQAIPSADWENGLDWS